MVNDYYGGYARPYYGHRYAYGYHDVTGAMTVTEATGAMIATGAFIVAEGKKIIKLN